MTAFEIKSHIEEIESDSSLYEEKNFDKRTEAIDFLDFQFTDRIEALLKNAAQQDELILLKCRAEKVKSQLKEINTSLFQELRENIQKGEYKGQAFRNLVNEYVDFDLSNSAHQQEAGYDNLDIFINGLFSFQTIPEQTKDLEPEMVFYQKTPARIVFELAEKCPFIKDDVFFDLGSGLGQVAMLVNLLAGVTVKGVEFEPAFCDYAQNCASELNLYDVTFVNADARNADYSQGTVFFMYTPFGGEMLQEALELLRKESLLRKIKLITYGPCTAEVASQSWLDSAVPKNDNIYKLAIFNSLMI
jgi:predicted RNA methylase